MPLLKPDTMNDILSTPELVRAGAPETKVQISFASTHSSADNKSLDSVRRGLPERIPAFGLLMALLSVVCFSIASLIVRIEVSLPAIEILVVRSVFQFVVYFIIILICRYDFLPQRGHRIDMMFRSISGTVSLSAIYIAYRMIPLSDASTIHLASPVFVIVFAYFLLKEPFSKLQIITGAVTLAGVIIIAKPEFLFGSELVTVHEMRFEGTLLAVIAAMAAAFAMISLRKLKTTPVAVVVMWYSFTLVIMGSVYLTVMDSWTMPTGTHTYTMLAIISVCGVFDQYLITLAFQYEKAGPISVIRTFNIVLSFMWEVLLLNEKIEFTSIIGACLICSCVILLGLVKWNKESPETFDKIRRKFCCFCSAPGPSQKAKMESKKKLQRNKLKSSAKSADIENEEHIHRSSLSNDMSGSNESIDSIAVQNTVNSNAILLMKSDDEADMNEDIGAEGRLASFKTKKSFFKKSRT